MAELALGLLIPNRIGWMLGFPLQDFELRDCQTQDPSRSHSSTGHMLLLCVWERVRGGGCILLKSRCFTSVRLEGLEYKGQAFKCQEEQGRSVQLFSGVRLFATPWTTAHQACLSITNSWSLLKLTSIRVFSNESILCIRWPKYWSFSFSISPSNEYSGLISFRIDWFDLLAVQGEQDSSVFIHPMSKSCWNRAEGKMARRRAVVVGEVSRKLLAQGGAQSALPHPSPCALPPYTSSPLSPPGVLAVQLGCLLKKPGGQGNLFSTMHTHSDKPPPTHTHTHTHWAVGKGCGEEFLSPDPSPAARKRLWTISVSPG